MVDRFSVDYQKAIVRLVKLLYLNVRILSVVAFQVEHQLFVDVSRVYDCINAFIQF